MRTAAIIAAAAILWAAFGCGCSSSRPPGSAAPAKQDRGGVRTAPDFELKDSRDELVHLSDYRGKVVVLNFWATWCGPCKIEIPWFNDLEQKNKDKGFSVIGVSIDDEGLKVVKPFLADFNVNYRVVIGGQQASWMYGVGRMLPTIFLIGRDGQIAAAYRGVVNRKDLEQHLEELLQAPSPACRRPTLPLAQLADSMRAGVPAATWRLPAAPWRSASERFPKAQNFSTAHTLLLEVAWPNAR